MTTLENMPDGLIPFPYGHLLGYESVGILHIAIATLATACCLLIIMALYKAGPYQDSKFLLSLCIADLLYSALHIIIHGRNLYYGGFSFGKMGCVVGSGLVWLTAGAAIYSLAAMAINLYLVLIKGVYMSDWQKNGIIVAFWVFLTAFPASFLSTGYRFKGMAYYSIGMIVYFMNV